MPTLLMPVSGSRITARPAVMYLPRVLLMIGADRQLLDIDLVADADDLLHRAASHPHRVDRMSLARRTFPDEFLDAAVFHAERATAAARNSRACWRPAECSDPFTFSKMTSGKRPSRSRPFEDAGDAEFRVDLLADADDLVRDARPPGNRGTRAGPACRVSSTGYSFVQSPSRRSHDGANPLARRY